MTTNPLALRLMAMLGANLAIVALAFAGLAVACGFAGLPLFLLLFVISLLQGALMIRAFGPVTVGVYNLSSAGKAVGYTGLAAWFGAHLINAALAATDSEDAAAGALIFELLMYGACHTIVLLPSYTRAIRNTRAAGRETAASEFRRLVADAEQRDADLQRQDERRIRESIRFACQTLYDRHRLALRDRLPPDQLQEYFDRYLSEACPVCELEGRAEQLKELILEVVKSNGSRRTRHRSLDELLDAYRREEESLLLLDIDDDARASLMADLARERDQSIREMRQA